MFSRNRGNKWCRILWSIWTNVLSGKESTKCFSNMFCILPRDLQFCNLEEVYFWLQNCKYWYLPTHFFLIYKVLSDRQSTISIPSKCNSGKHLLHDGKKWSLGIFFFHENIRKSLIMHKKDEKLLRLFLKGIFFPLFCVGSRQINGQWLPIITACQQWEERANHSPWCTFSHFFDGKIYLYTLLILLLG